MDRVDKKDDEEKGYINLFYISKNFLEGYFYIREIDKYNFSSVTLLFLSLETILKSYVCLDLETKKVAGFYNKATTCYGHKITKIIKDYKDDVFLSQFYDDKDLMTFVKLLEESFLTLRYGENTTVYLRSRKINKTVELIQAVRIEIEKRVDYKVSWDIQNQMRKLFK